MIEGLEEIERRLPGRCCRPLPLTAAGRSALRDPRPQLAHLPDDSTSSGIGRNGFCTLFSPGRSPDCSFEAPRSSMNPRVPPRDVGQMLSGPGVKDGHMAFLRVVNQVSVAGGKPSTQNPRACHQDKIGRVAVGSPGKAGALDRDLRR